MSKSSRSRYSTLNVSSGLIGQTVTILLGFLTRTIFIYTLGKSFLGISGLFQNVLQILSIADLGLESAIVFSLYKPLVDKDEEKISAIIHLYKHTYRIIGAVILAVGVCLTPFIKYIINGKSNVVNIEIVFLLFLIQTASSYLLFSYRKTVYVADQHSYKSTVISFFVRVISCALQILTLLLFKNYYAYLIIEIAMIMLSNVIVGIFAGKDYPCIKKKPKNKLPKEDLDVIKKNVFGATLYKICGVVTNSTDNILISSIVGIEVVGVYSNYLLFTNYIQIFLNLIFNGITASIGNLFVTETKEHNEFIFRCVNFLNIWLFGFCGIAFYCLINPFMILWLQDESYLLSSKTVFIIFFYFVLVGLQYSIKSYRSACGLFWKGKIRPVFTAIINLVVSIILGYYIGLDGILIGTIVSHILTLFWYDPILLYKEVFKKSSTLYFIRYIFSLAIVVIFALGLEFFMSFLPVTAVYFVLRLFIVVIVPNIIMLVVSFRTKEFKYIYNNFLVPVLKKISKNYANKIKIL